MIVIGDEILGGFVQDTNSAWVAARLQALGIPLDRVITVPDDADAIDEALRTELARPRPRVVITSGGIGSTPDDVTFEAVARHLGVGLVVEETIDERITQALEWTVHKGGTVTEAHEESMRRMALIPESAYLLPGSEAFSPGIAIDVDGSAHDGDGATIVILPGVPSLLQRIVEVAVEPNLLAGRGHPLHVAEVSHGYPESTLNNVLVQIVREFPDVHVGSYPGTECTIRLKGPRERVETAMGIVTDELARLERDEGANALRAAWRARWS